jgi:four helix bundle protein
VIRGFRDLAVWKRAHALVLETYDATKAFPPEEKFGIVSQMRRAAVSVAANIAEGSKRRTTPDLQHFLVMAEGSLEELKYYFILSGDLTFCSVDEARRLQALCDEVGRMLNALVRSLERKAPKKEASMPPSNGALLARTALSAVFLLLGLSSYAFRSWTPGSVSSPPSLTAYHLSLTT